MAAIEWWPAGLEFGIAARDYRRICFGRKECGIDDVLCFSYLCSHGCRSLLGAAEKRRKLLARS